MNEKKMKRAGILTMIEDVALSILSESFSKLAHEADMNSRKHEGLMHHHSRMEDNLRDRDEPDHDEAQKHARAAEMHYHAALHFQRAQHAAINRKDPSGHSKLGRLYARDANEHETKHHLSMPGGHGEVNESLRGKNQLKDVVLHHRDEVKKSRGAKRDYHNQMLARARRVVAMRDRVAPHNPASVNTPQGRKHNVEYMGQDSKRAKELKSKITED